MTFSMILGQFSVDFGVIFDCFCWHSIISKFQWIFDIFWKKKRAMEKHGFLENHRFTQEKQWFSRCARLGKQHEALKKTRCFFIKQLNKFEQKSMQKQCKKLFKTARAENTMENAPPDQYFECQLRCLVDFGTPWAPKISSQIDLGRENWDSIGLWGCSGRPKSKF